MANPFLAQDAAPGKQVGVFPLSRISKFRVKEQRAGAPDDNHAENEPCGCSIAGLFKRQEDI
jgi:hypothetical protein